MNIADLMSVQLSIEDIMSFLAVPALGAAILSIAWMISWAWELDEASQSRLRTRKKVLMASLAAGGLIVIVAGAVYSNGLYTEKSGPVRAANGAAVQAWAQETYGVALMDEDAQWAAGKTKAYPAEAHTLTVSGPDGRRTEILLRTDQNGELYLMDAATRSELPAR